MLVVLILDSEQTYIGAQARTATWPKSSGEAAKRVFTRLLPAGSLRSSLLARVTQRKGKPARRLL